MMVRYLYTIHNPQLFNETQIQNNTLQGLDSILNMGSDWYDNQRYYAQKSIAEGKLLDYTRDFFEDRVEINHVWDSAEFKEEYDNNANISAILDKLEKVGYTVTVYVTEI